jgi:PAS domain S-box-containing protein
MGYDYFLFGLLLGSEVSSGRCNARRFRDDTVDGVIRMGVWWESGRNGWIAWAATLLALILIAACAGRIYFLRFQRDNRAKEGDNLAAIASLQASQVAKWRSEHLSNILSVSADSAMAQTARRFFDTGNPDDRATLLTWLSALCRQTDCRSATLLSLETVPILAVGDEDRRPGPRVSATARQSLQTREAVLSDLHHGMEIPEVHLDLVAPILLRQGAVTSAVANVLLRIDPHRSLYPILLGWQNASPSGETVLFRRDGEEVVYLNEVRHWRNAPLALRVPLSRRSTAAVLAICGKTGVFTAQDYRGETVLAAARPVPGSPWHILVKKDLREVDAPIRREAGRVLVTASGWVLSLCIMIFALWRQERLHSAHDRAAWKQRYELATAAAGQVTYEYDPVSGETLWGGSVQAVLGYDLPEIQQGGRFVHPSDQAFVREQFREINRTHAPHDFEYRFRHRDGRYVRVRDQGVSLQGEDGGWRVISMLTDITARRETETALQRSEERYRLLFTKMREGFALLEIITNEQGTPIDYRFLEVNPAYQALSGKREEDLVGHTALEAASNTERHWIDILGQVALTGTPVSLTHHATDTSRWYSVTAFCPKIGQVAIIFEDITEHHRLEAQFRQAQKFEAIGRLAGGVAHDFNNILTAILGYADLLLNQPLVDSTARPQILEIQRAGERATALTRQLLAFSSRQPTRRQVLSLNQVIPDMEKLLRRLIGEHIRFETQLAPDLSCVLADRSQIEQVLLNLTVNARDAMPGGGCIRIQTSNKTIDADFLQRNPSLHPGPHVVLTVSDTGCGMSREVLAHLFEPFFSTKTLGKGSGLGLATVYGIVRQSEGDIVVDSQVGVGTTFHIYLPAVDGVLSPDLPEDAPAPASTAGGHETLLVVEDEPAVRQLAVDTLRRAGYQVLEAADGEDAMRVAEQHGFANIHLLCTDVVMPGMDGRALAVRLRKHHPNLRVLFVSGYVNVLHGSSGNEPEQEMPLLPKPYSANALTQRIRSLLDVGKLGLSSEQLP